MATTETTLKQTMEGVFSQICPLKYNDIIVRTPENSCVQMTDDIMTERTDARTHFDGTQRCKGQFTVKNKRGRAELWLVSAPEQVGQ